MNTPSPLIPQGATPPRVNSSLYFKVLMILTVHVVVIGGMLLQGCKDTPKDQVKTDGTSTTPGDTVAMNTGNTSTTAPASTASSTEVPPVINPNIQGAYNGTTDSAAAMPAQGPATSATAAVPTLKSTDIVPPATTGETKEYVIVKGDTLGSIARKNGLAVKALKEANPGVDSRKLRIGQKIQIPAAVAAMAAASSTDATGAAPAETGEGSVYTVKPGDVLIRIAKAHHTSTKKIMAMNDLKSTSIRAGQKLKMPAPKTSSAEPAAASAPASASLTPPGLQAAPAAARTSGVAPVAAN